MAQQLTLFDQLSAYEGPDVEYKSARGGLPGSLWETYSAFANTHGGTIFLGIAQKGDELDVHGVQQPEKLLSEFWSCVNNRGKVSINLLTNRDVDVVTLEGFPHPVVSIHVPRATRQQRPVYVGSHPFEGTYRRNHEGDYKCTADEVRRMFADQGDEPADQRLLDGFTIDDLDADSIRQYRNRFTSRDPAHPWLAEDDQTLLTKLGALRRDRTSGSLGLTVAGLLMFGRTEAITSPEAVPGFHLDYRERLSDDPAVRWSDRLTADGTWEANLFHFYQRVIVKLGMGPGIRTPFQLDAEGYRQAGSAVHEALQEALVNALIHADHFGQGGVVVDRYVERFVFSNPGTLLVSREQLLKGGISECRNKSLQKMFQMLGVGDKAGSGIDRIRTNWAAQHWSSPRLRETNRPDRVELSLPMVSTLPPEAVEELHRQFGSQFEALGPDEVQALVAAHVEGDVSNQRLQEMLSLHRVDITKLLRGLVDGGFLAPSGVGRGRRYAAVSAVVPVAEHRRSFQGKDPSFQGKDPSFQGKDSSFQGKDSSFQGSEVALLAIAEPVRSTRRARPPEMRKAILGLCTGRFLSLRDLSMLLKRHPESLRNEHIGPLVKVGRLTLRYPSRPRHPDQQYRTSEGAPCAD